MQPVDQQPERASSHRSAKRVQLIRELPTAHVKLRVGAMGWAQPDTREDRVVVRFDEGTLMDVSSRYLRVIADAGDIVLRDRQLERVKQQLIDLMLTGTSRGDVLKLTHQAVSEAYTILQKANSTPVTSTESQPT